MFFQNLNYLVWIDQDNISGDILTSMASAVENAFVVLMAINDEYHKSRYCRLGQFENFLVFRISESI